MAVFGPIDSREGGSWFRTTDRKSDRPEDINREIITRWLASVAPCMCFAALAPVPHLSAFPNSDALRLGSGLLVVLGPMIVFEGCELGS
jgi:hypothetical protein